MTRHKLPISKLKPDWADDEKNDCLVSIGEEVYTARALAVSWGAEEFISSAELLRAGDKSRDVMDDDELPYGKRCVAGERALRKYWEAKSSARRKQKGAG